VGEIAPKRRSRCHSTTRGLEWAWDGSEYETTIHDIGYLAVRENVISVADFCKINYKLWMGAVRPHPTAVKFSPPPAMTQGLLMEGALGFMMTIIS
jgi:hypothetical protein